MAAGMLPGGLFTPQYRDVRADEQNQERTLQNLAADPTAATAYASYAGMRQAGRGLGTAVAEGMGLDARSPEEKLTGAQDSVKRAVLASGAQPGTEEYYTALARAFNNAGLPDAANNAIQAWETIKLNRAHSDYYEVQRAKANRVPAKDHLMDKYWETVEKIQNQGDAADPALVKMRDSLGKALGIKDPSEWAIVAPTPTSPGYKYNKVTGDTAELNGRIPPQPKTQHPTIATIADPKDETKTLVVDANVFNAQKYLQGDNTGVVSAGPKLTEVGRTNLKTQIAHAGTADAIARARAILTGQAGNALPTESGLGTAVDYAGSLVGYTPKGAEQADQLRVVGGSLVRNVPRFEGPQSDKDVAYYKEVAGRIGDSTLPIQRRLAALDEVERIWGEYEGGKKYGFFSPTNPNAAKPDAGLGAPGRRVRVKMPDGQVGTIPAASLAAAKAKGAVEVK